MKRQCLSALAITLLGCTVTTAAAEESSSKAFSTMFSEAKASLNLRYRYEYVDQQGIEETAGASTLRSRLTFTSASWRGLSFLTEFDDVTAIGDDNYNSTANGNIEYPVVADPEGTEVNQAWLKYSAGQTSGSYGRQRILHGNQRFVGGVGWRQNEQTYDGFRAVYKSNPINFDYAYVYKVNRIFGPDDSAAQPADHSGENHFLRADWTISKDHTLSVFAYLLDVDFDEDYAAGKTVGNSSDTYGLEYQGALGPVSIKAAYASQSDAGDNPVTYDADYYMFEGAMKLGAVKGIVGYEVLAAGDGVGFKTPYATLHKFQGWADKFLITPADGVEDAYLGLTGKWGAVSLGGFYHHFSAEDSSEDWGTELDLVASWNYNKHWMFQLKYANFSSDSDLFADTDKAWLTVNFKI